jgi:hypothetical protein
MHENKTYFYVFEIGRFVLKKIGFYFKISRITKYLNTGFVSYNVNLQPNIKWNSWRKTYLVLFNEFLFRFYLLFIFFWNFKEKPGIFNIGIVSYNVSLQLWLGKLIGKHAKDL